MDQLLSLVITLSLLLTAFWSGRYAERRHYQSIRERERRFLNQPALTARSLDADKRVRDARLAMGSVVVSVDYFKRLLAGFRMLVGGELRAYSPLIDRGRREAILRMKEACPGADAYVNMRLETSTISRGAGRAIGTVEVIAYSTAITYEKEPPETANPGPGAAPV